MAAEWFATAIKLSPKRADLHFQLGQVLEEQHYVQDLYGIKPPVSYLIVSNMRYHARYLAKKWPEYMLESSNMCNDKIFSIENRLPSYFHLK